MESKPTHALKPSAGQVEERYRMLFEHTGVALMFVAADTTITLVNREFERLTGYSRELLEGRMSWTELIPDPEDLQRMKSYHQLRRINPADVPGVYESRIRSRQGENLDVTLHVTVIPNTEDSLVSLLDMTEVKRAGRALAEQETRLRAVTRNIPGVVFQFHAVDNGEYATQYASERLAEIFGLPTEPKADFSDFVAHVHQEDRERFMATIRSSVAACGEWRFEGRFVKPSGELIWFHGLSTPTRQADRLVFNGMLLDITARKRAEERFKELAELQQTILDTITPGLTFVKERALQWTNAAFNRIFGYEAAEVKGVDSSVFYAEAADYRLIGTEGYRQLARGEIFSREIRMKRKDGSLFWCHVVGKAISPVRLEEGSIWMLQDITQRRGAEEERQKLQEQLLQLQKMEAVGRLAGGVAHDFNNMLGVILGQVELAQMKVAPTEPLHGDLQEIEKAARRSAELTRQLLAFARKQTIDPKVLDLNGTLSGMLTLLRRLIGEDIDLVWQPGRDLWPVKVDRSQLDQVLTNLCINARDAILGWRHSASGAGRITIETAPAVFDDVYCCVHPDCIPGEFVSLAVSDNGRGMNRETMDNLFEPFFTTKATGRGTGLGLATVYGIVKQNNGFINVYSELGRGTTFRIYFPRHGGQADPMRTDADLAERPGGHETILLVEDEPGILKMSRSMLEVLGYQVLSTTSPNQALRLAEAHGGEIHLLMTDVVMPEMNGRNLSRRLLEKHPGLKSLFSSGYTANVIAHQGVLEPGVHFIQKPFTFRDLAAKVRAVLDETPHPTQPLSGG